MKLLKLIGNQIRFYIVNKEGAYLESLTRKSDSNQIRFKNEKLCAQINAPTLTTVKDSWRARSHDRSHFFDFRSRA